MNEERREGRRELEEYAPADCHWFWFRGESRGWHVLICLPILLPRRMLLWDPRQVLLLEKGGICVQQGERQRHKRTRSRTCTPNVFAHVYTAACVDMHFNALITHFVAVLVCCKSHCVFAKVCTLRRHVHPIRFSWCGLMSLV
jgi:hypothetical protein